MTKSAEHENNPITKVLTSKYRISGSYWMEVFHIGLEFFISDSGCQSIYKVYMHISEIHIEYALLIAWEVI